MTDIFNHKSPLILLNWAKYFFNYTVEHFHFRVTNMVFLETSINTKLKKLYLSPHLKCLSPHVAIGDKVEQRCSR